MVILISNKIVTYLVNAITATDTQIVIGAQDYQQIFSAGLGDIYVILRSTTAREIIKIDLNNSVSGSYLAVVRGQGGTIAAAWPVGTKVLGSTNADHYNSILQAGGYRTIGYNPNEVLIPLHAGEKVYQNLPAGCERWWKSFNAVNPYWDIITGVPCGAEEYEDIGWDYELLMPVELWFLAKVLYNEDPYQQSVNAAAYDSFHGTLVVGTGNSGQIWKSSDGGNNWVLKKQLNLESPGSSNITSMVYDSANHDLYAGTFPYAEVWKSSDGGDTWARSLDLSIPAFAFTGCNLGYDPVNDYLYCGTYSGSQTYGGRIYRSIDQGATWPLNKDLTGEPVLTSCHDFAFDTSRNRMFVATGERAQVWMTPDGGANWTKQVDLLTQEGGNTRNANSAAYDIEHDVLLIGTSSDAKIFTSKDGGVTFVMKINLELQNPNVDYIMMLLYNPVKKWIFAGTGEDAEMWLSKDGGDTWEKDKDDFGEIRILAGAYDSAYQMMIFGTYAQANIWQRGN